MNTRPKRAAAVGVALIVVAAAAWFFIFRDTAPEAVSLEEAVGAVTSTTGQTSTSDSLDGSWTIDTTIGGGVVENSSFGGYRVREELASVGAFTAVGRSTGLTGTFSFTDTTLESADIGISFLCRENIA